MRIKIAMNKEKLNELRSKIPIPLGKALSLLKQHDGNIEICIQTYHEDNIRKITERTGCEHQIAFNYYHNAAYENNVEKIIEKVSAYMRKPIKLTIEENPLHVDKVGFFIWVEDENLETVQDARNRTYFIPSYDFSFVIGVFESVFPLFSPIREELELDFDVFSDNYFDMDATSQIIQKLRKLHYEDPRIINFIKKLVQCLDEKRQIGKYINIFGNQ